MFLSNPFPGAFGLDIGDISIKLVRLSYHARFFGEPYFKLQEVRTIGLPPGVIVGGEIQQPEVARRKILRLLGKEGPEKPITSPWVVADLPDPKTFLKLIEIDTPAKELIYDDVAYHAKKHVPFEIEETYLDWQIIDHAEDTASKTRVLLTATPKVIADSYTYLLEAAGLNPLALEVEAISSARAMITSQKDYAQEGRIILDIGATRSSLVVYDQNSIQFSTNINFSGEIVTMAIAQGLKLEYSEAEKLKIANGLRYNKQHPKYLKIVATLVENLALEIRKALAFYKEHFANTNHITKITLCGGGASFSNMDNILSHRLRISTHPGNVWKNISARPVTETERARGLPLASAIGLAIRAAQNPLKS